MPPAADQPMEWRECVQSTSSVALAGESRRGLTSRLTGKNECSAPHPSRLRRDTFPMGEGFGRSAMPGKQAVGLYPAKRDWREAFLL